MFEFITTNPYRYYLSIISLFFFISGCVGSAGSALCLWDADCPMFLFAAAFWPVTSIIILLFFTSAGISALWDYTHFDRKSKIKLYNARNENDLICESDELIVNDVEGDYEIRKLAKEQNLSIDLYPVPTYIMTNKDDVAVVNNMPSCYKIYFFDASDKAVFLMHWNKNDSV
jgi:hypothetical protein